MAAEFVLFIIVIYNSKFFPNRAKATRGPFFTLEGWERVCACISRRNVVKLKYTLCELGEIQFTCLFLEKYCSQRTLRKKDASPQPNAIKEASSKTQQRLTVLQGQNNKCKSWYTHICITEVLTTQPPSFHEVFTRCFNV